MKMIRRTLPLIWLGLALISSLLTNASAETQGGLIISGLDTLPAGRGFDFVLERPCTTSSDVNCFYHFNFFWYGPDINYFAQLNPPNGLMLDVGKINLDSIKSAPPDSLMFDNYNLGQLYVFFRIAPDSLSKCVGNVYILKTATDPREGYPLYAKIRIIKFIAVDSSQHIVKMVFLWAYNNSGVHDLTTSGLDTFHLQGPPVAVLPRPSSIAGHAVSFSGGSRVFTVVGDVFTVPRELEGKAVRIAVFDLRGRRLGEMEIGNRGTVDLSRVAGDGVRVVRVIENQGRNLH